MYEYSRYDYTRFCLFASHSHFVFVSCQINGSWHPARPIKRKYKRLQLHLARLSSWFPARTQDVVALGRFGGSQRWWGPSKSHTIWHAIALWVQINNNLNIIIKYCGNFCLRESKNVAWFFCIHIQSFSLCKLTIVLYSKQLRRLCDMLVNELNIKTYNG